MTRCFFASDLHGDAQRYAKLFTAIERESPGAVFLGGDLTPGMRPAAHSGDADFFEAVLVRGLQQLRQRLGSAYPRVFAIMGNDDLRSQEPSFHDLEARELWTYVHGRREVLGAHRVYGYAFVPPTPFRLKDWERYDVSAYVDPGCVSPEEGQYSVPVDRSRLRYESIAQDLERLAGDESLEQAILLCHTPPYRSRLDRAALDDKRVDHVPMDVHVGSIALQRFITARQPLLTLHGHVHESARLSGSWQDRIGRTWMFSAAHDGPELALVRFDPEDPAAATRELL